MTGYMLRNSEKFLLFAMMVLNSLMVILEVLLSLSALCLYTLSPNHQNIKTATQSSSRKWWGLDMKGKGWPTLKMAILGSGTHCLSLAPKLSRLQH